MTKKVGAFIFVGSILFGIFVVIGEFHRSSQADSILSTQRKIERDVYGFSRSRRDYPGKWQSPIFITLAGISVLGAAVGFSVMLTAKPT